MRGSTGRQVLVVAAGYDHVADLRRLGPVIREHRQRLIRAGAGADALRAVLFDPGLGLALLATSGVGFIPFTLYTITPPRTTPRNVHRAATAAPTPPSFASRREPHTQSDRGIEDRLACGYFNRTLAIGVFDDQRAALDVAGSDRTSVKERRCGRPPSAASSTCVP